MLLALQLHRLRWSIVAIPVAVKLQLASCYRGQGQAVGMEGFGSIVRVMGQI